MPFSRAMTARTLPSLLLLLAGLGVSLGLIAFHEPEDADVPNTEVERIDRPVDSGQDVEGGYHTLVTGGPMYAGTVLSVTVKRFDPETPTSPGKERGSLRFRVDRTVAGPDVR